MKLKKIFFALFVCLLLSCNDKVDSVPKQIDHLVYTAPSLEEGIQKIEELLGVKAVIGGRHPNYGTHNALLSLGETTYFEIIAPDPDLPVPERGRLLGDSYEDEPKLTTWVLRVEQIERMHSNALENGVKLGHIESGKREKPDGTVLNWKITDPYAFPIDGTIPFLISWGETTHPASVVPRAGELIGFEIEHPNPDEVRESLKILGVNIKIIKGKETKLRAIIKTENGIVNLE